MSIDIIVDPEDKRTATIQQFNNPAPEESEDCMYRKSCQSSNQTYAQTLINALSSQSMFGLQAVLLLIKAGR